MSEQRTNFLGLWNPICGSADALWHGSTLEAAAQEWRQLVAQRPGEEVDLTAYGAGELASHAEMQWRYGTPTGTFACPICGKDAPHEHTGEAIARHRDLEAWKQRDMEKRWERIEARIAELAAIHGVPKDRAADLDELLTQILNRRVTIEQRMFDAAAGKRPMPTAEELRQWAIELGTPASGVPPAAVELAI
jgi:DNA repair exonuclease SbcCD ATPase subunit